MFNTFQYPCLSMNCISDQSFVEIIVCSCSEWVYSYCRLYTVYSKLLLGNGFTKLLQRTPNKSVVLQEIFSCITREFKNLSFMIPQIFSKDMAAFLRPH